MAERASATWGEGRVVVEATTQSSSKARSDPQNAALQHDPTAAGCKPAPPQKSKPPESNELQRATRCGQCRVRASVRRTRLRSAGHRCKRCSGTRCWHEPRTAQSAASRKWQTIKHVAGVSCNVSG